MKTVSLKKVDVLAAIKKHCYFTLILCIIAIGVGIALCWRPGYTSGIAIWVAFGLIALAGLTMILRFIFPGKGNKRDGFSLVFGIMLDALFAILLTCAFFCPPGEYKDFISGQIEPVNGFENFSIGLIIFFSIFSGVVAVFNGIMGLVTIGNVETKSDKVLSVIVAILGIVLGVLMIIFPGIFWFIGCIITAIYLFIMAIIGIVLSCKAIHALRKAKKNGVSVEATVVEFKDDGKDVIENK